MNLELQPRLILLTGPAAGEVAEGLRPNVETYTEPWAFEVRDYLDAGRSIGVELTGRLGMRASLPAEIEEAIRSLPGGEAWLVGLVLPEAKMIAPRMDGNHQYLHWGRGACLSEGLPLRLAILAPEPPPLLVERVRAWGGEVWECEIGPDKDDQTCQCIAVKGFRYCELSWPEAVRVALGEVAPC